MFMVGSIQYLIRIIVTIVSVGFVFFSGGLQAEIQFENISTQAGIQRVGLSWSIASGDYNGDNRPDVLTTNHNEEPSLYLNLGENMFIDIVATEIPELFGDMHGASWADFDNDGEV